MSSPPVLVIGYGNTLRGDDGLGRLAAAQLAASVDTDRVQVIDCHQLTLDLAPLVSAAQCLILIDAAAPENADAVPGTIHRTEIVVDAGARQSLGHYMEPGALLASAQALYGAVPRCWLWTVIAATFEHGEGLSPAVAAALPNVVAQVRALIAEYS